VAECQRARAAQRELGVGAVEQRELVGFPGKLRAFNVALSPEADRPTAELLAAAQRAGCPLY